MEIKVEHIIFWTLILILIIFLLWRAFGSSPTVESIGLILAAIGAYFGWYGLKRSDVHTQLLKEIKDILEKKL